MTLEARLAATEADLIVDLIERGIVPAGARRMPTANELRAGTRFAELDRIVTDAAALVTRRIDPVRTFILDGLADVLAGSFGDPDPWAAVESLADWTDPTNAATIPGLTKLLDDVRTQVTADLVTAGRSAYLEAASEPVRQGAGPGQPLNGFDAAAVRPAAEAHARQVARAHVDRLLDVAAQAGTNAATLPGATGASVVEAALDAAETASRAGAEDLAKQAANVTHGLGRTQALAAAPTPVAVYASELLDGNTCGPCAQVDGRTYTDLDTALIDYPGAGGYVACAGGSRCRGTLVLVHGTEAPPTLKDPGRGPAAPGGPVDDTPRGPATGTPGDDALPVGAASGIDWGADPVPATAVATPIEVAAPADVDRDPELATWEDHHLEQVLDDPNETIERRMAAADELDHRAAGTRTRVDGADDEVDAATLARWEAEEEEWRARGGTYEDLIRYTPGAKDRPQGRAIDRVRDEWGDHLAYEYVRMENATRGVMLRADRAAEFARKYGTDVARVLLEGRATSAYYYASQEVRDYWEANGGRQTFDMFALARGIDDSKTRKRAAAAERAVEDAKRLAEESADRRKERRNKRPRRTLTAGEKLAAEQRRRDRQMARARKLAAEAGES